MSPPAPPPSPRPPAPRGGVPPRSGSRDGVPPPRPSAPARDDADMGPSTWLDGLLAEAGHATTPLDLVGGASGHGALDTPGAAPPPGAEPAPRPASRHPGARAAGRTAGRSAARAGFDACQPGVVLRALLFVHGVLALVLAAVAGSAAGWLGDLAMMVAIALPATLVWLIGVCRSQGWWSRAPLWQAHAAMAALGGLAALLPWTGLVAAGLLAPRGLGAGAPLAVGAAFALLVFHWLQLRRRLQLPATTVARLAELQSRIRPHFLFNALNSAVALVRIDPQKAEDVLEDLAELFRAALGGAGEQVTLGEEVALAQRYLAIEQVRFGARLQLSWQLDPAADGARVPALLLQPLVENAVRHGVEPAAEGGLIQVRTQVHKGQALISITNSLPPAAKGAPPAYKGQGMALRNVRERLLLLHDVAMRFEAGVIAADRYRVRIAVPLRGG